VILNLDNARPTSHHASRPAAGDALLHPAVVAALAVLVVNDHVGKDLARGTAWATLTGKASDVAGVLFLPVLVVAGLELAAAARGRYRGPSARMAMIVAALVAVAFAAMKTHPLAGDVYRYATGALQWPWHAAVAAVHGRVAPPVLPVRHVVDPTDLVALPAAGWAIAQARARARSWASSGATNAANDAR